MSKTGYEEDFLRPMLSNAKQRKAKERQSRDELILSVARQLLAKNGLPGLSMQGIADHTEYSKGTIYLHYGCKEDVVARLVIGCGKNLIEFIDLALANGDSLRHKVVLASAAFFMNAQVQPEIALLVAKVKSPDFKVKLSEQYLVELSQIDDDILKRVLTLFADGTGFDQQKVLDAAFGWWAMKWGVQDVLANGWDMSELGFDDPRQCFFRSLHYYLDGLGVPKDSRCHDWSTIQLQAQQIFKMDASNNNKEKS